MVQGVVNKLERHPSDRLFDTILREEVRRLNQHLPKQRRFLNELLSDDSPQVSTVDGKIIPMRRDELERLSSLLSADAMDKVRLPIVLIRRGEMGLGAFTVLGDKPEMYAVARLLGAFEGSLEDYRRLVGPELIIYKPQVSELTRSYHSLVIIGFGVPEDLHAAGH